MYFQGKTSAEDMKLPIIILPGTGEVVEDHGMNNPPLNQTKVETSIETGAESRESTGPNVNANITVPSTQASTENSWVNGTTRYGRKIGFKDAK